MTTEKIEFEALVAGVVEAYDIELAAANQYHKFSDAYDVSAFSNHDARIDCINAYNTHKYMVKVLNARKRKLSKWLKKSI